MATERFGFIREKLDIKLLILYVLDFLPAKVSFQELSDLVLIDGGFDYFEYSQCLSELTVSGHVSVDGDWYRITEIGSAHLNTVVSSLPYSVKAKAKKQAEPTLRRMEREALVGASHSMAESGVCTVRLSLSDDMGKILDLSLLTDSEEKALSMEEYFRKNAESVFHQMIRLLTPEDSKREE